MTGQCCTPPDTDSPESRDIAGTKSSNMDGPKSSDVDGTGSRDMGRTKSRDMDRTGSRNIDRQAARRPAWPFARTASSIFPGALLVLLPKCPLCLAAWLTVATGVGVSAAGAAWVRGTLVVLLVAAAALAAAPIVSASRARRRVRFVRARAEVVQRWSRRNPGELSLVPGVSRELRRAPSSSPH